MRFISFILAAYILVSALVPCSDGETCVDEARQGIVLAADVGHEHSGREQDVCTPFCICSCCSAHVRLPYAVAIEGNDLFHNTPLITGYIEKPVLDPSQSIWQPPRI